MKPYPGKLNKLFVYGIFLGEDNRKAFGMSNPRYTVVRNYATEPVGGSIVTAVPLKGYNLTGLYVDVDPTNWEDIDRLEGGYDRIKVDTLLGKAWMYVKPQ